MTEKNHSPVKRNRLVAHVVTTCKTSQRRACWAIGFHRATIRYQYRRKPDEETLRVVIVGLATLYGAYGYRMVIAKPSQAGGQSITNRWLVSDARKG